MQSFVVVHAPRARAVLGACGLALMALVVPGTMQLVDAATQTPLPTPSALFGVHPVQEGRTTLPGGHFNFALVRGQRISDAIVVENLSATALSFHVYSADLITAIGGGTTPAQPATTKRAVGAWILVSQPTVTIAAHGQVTDTFTITVPITASVGQHVGAVVASADIGITAQGTPIEARAALIAVVTVAGTVRASATLTALLGSGAGSGKYNFGVTLSNTGNVLLTYVGSVTIEDADGRTVDNLRLTPINAYVVPSGDVPLAALWIELGSLGASYHAQASVTILANGVPVRTLTSQVLMVQLTSGGYSWMVVGPVGVLILIVALAIWNRRRVLDLRHQASRRSLGPGTAR
ncbi:MAG TPA: hypothetical protein VI434_13745 [Candidatus Dormibacteraeota bacterium]